MVDLIKFLVNNLNNFPQGIIFLQEEVNSFLKNENKKILLINVLGKVIPYLLLIFSAVIMFSIIILILLWFSLSLSDKVDRSLLYIVFFIFLGLLLILARLVSSVLFINLILLYYNLIRKIEEKTQIQNNLSMVNFMKDEFNQFINSLKSNSKFILETSAYSTWILIIGTLLIIAIFTIPIFVLSLLTPIILIILIPLIFIIILLISIYLMSIDITLITYTVRELQNASKDVYHSLEPHSKLKFNIREFEKVFSFTFYNIIGQYVAIVLLPVLIIQIIYYLVSMFLNIFKIISLLKSFVEILDLLLFVVFTILSLIITNLLIWVYVKYLLKKVSFSNVS